MISKTKISRSDSNAVNVIFNSEELSKAKNTGQATAKKKKEKKKSKKLEKRNNYQNMSLSRLFAIKNRTTIIQIDKKWYRACQACGGP